MPETLLVTRPEDLAGFSLNPEPCLSTRDNYHQYYNAALSEYQAFLARNPRYESRPYQPEFAALYASRRHNICAGAPGLGKTLITGLAIKAIYGNVAGRRPGTVQILAPNWLSAQTRWLKDLELLPSLRGQVALIKNAKDITNATAPVWIYTQDFLKRNHPNPVCKSRPAVSRYLKQINRMPKFLVIDEVHNLQPNSQRTKHVSYVRQHSKRSLALSGTLSDGRLSLIHSTSKLIYAQHWPYQTESGFFKEYGGQRTVKAVVAIKEENTHRYLEQVALNKLPNYNELAMQFIHRVLLSDPNVLSCCRLPSLSINTITVPPNTEQYLAQQDLLYTQRQLVQALTHSSQTLQNRAAVLQILQPLARIANLPWEYKSKGKLNALQEQVVAALDNNQKVVIFTNQVAPANYIYNKLFEWYDQACTRLYSNDPNATPETLSHTERETRLSNFLYNPECKIAVMSIHLASESIDLTSAGTVIFWDLPWSAIKVQQAIYRACRPGSLHDEIDLYYLATEGLLDQHALTLVQEKLKSLSILLDNEVEEFAEVEHPVDLFELLNKFVL